jgi:hypothetical protein
MAVGPKPKPPISFFRPCNSKEVSETRNPGGRIILEEKSWRRGILESLVKKTRPPQCVLHYVKCLVEMMYWV